MHNGRPLGPTQTPASAGLQPGDMLLLVPRQLLQQQAGAGGRGQPQRQQQQQQPTALRRNQDGSLVNPAAAIQAMKQDRNLMDMVGHCLCLYKSKGRA
jgi:hypothetical protein